MLTPEQLQDLKTWRAEFPGTDAEFLAMANEKQEDAQHERHVFKSCSCGGR